MKKFLITLLILCLAGGIFYAYRTDKNIFTWWDRFQPASSVNQSDKPSHPRVTVQLKNGTVLDGELLSETALEYVILWEGGEMRFSKKEVTILKQQSEETSESTLMKKNDKGLSVRDGRLSFRSLSEWFRSQPIAANFMRFIRDIIEKIKSWFVVSVNAVSAGKALRPEGMVTVYLTNGSALTGKLLSDVEGIVKVLWQGGVVEFKAEEVVRVEKGEILDESSGIRLVEQKIEKWPYENDVVVKLFNGEVLDVAIDNITAKAIVVKYTFVGGGAIEQDIDRSKVECLMFKTVENERSQQIKASLKRLFPDMRFYTEGDITLVTDSYITWVRKYKRALLRVQTEVYCTFYELFKGRSPQVQHFVVIFDDPADYIEYAISDGVPGWVAPGYFSPQSDVLYLFNMAGERMENEITAMMKNYYGSSIDTAVGRAKQGTDDRYHVFLEGTAQDIKNKFWEYFDWWTAALRRTTFSILQHEFTHELFSNYGLQMVTASKLDQKIFPDLEKKRKFLATDDPDEKSKILMDLVTMKSKETLPDMSAANSWLVEGMATFCETDPVGSQNDERIFAFQEMMRQNAFLPLEQLTVYKIGSFPGVYPEAMLFAYAQSWALVRFLMERYPHEFLVYMQKIVATQPQGSQDIEWLVQAIGKDERTIESELKEYMQQFPQLEDPVIKILSERKKLQDSIAYFGDVKS
jgi:hypothetical protein